MIEFHDLTKDYLDARVLGPVSGSIEPGGITALIGPNGAGKSTLLTIIGRLLEPSGGSVTIDGTEVRSVRSRDLARRLAILRQENHLTARLTVEDLVGLGRFPHSLGRLTASDREQVESAISFLDLGDLRHRFLDQLSGGQRQRAFVAMVLAQDTDVVLLDEPLASLDLKHAVHMMRRLREAASALGKTIVIVIHDINMAAGYADRIVALRDGVVHSSGTVAEIMTETVLSAVYDTVIRVHDLDGVPTAVVAH
ncbi:iron ABC transporter ATP-binding protein [Arenivirga flava]|uniref:Iron ABC transporter ATP-binding protein n=1 Tax=Arenivirga flava TaxID=1930060 RepID=A0AA37UDS3_9MICO|nr:ATP-binding cassette domain-containing protein [Arenivirga flava]GMA27274.1 iron ABC transporter ATP-binding protein [Arenivirga flava]